MSNHTAPQSTKSFNPARAALYLGISLVMWMAFELITNAYHPGAFVAAMVMGLSSEVAVSSMERRAARR